MLMTLTSAKYVLHNWLLVESAHWKQKAKISWLEDGDRNTRFFHLSAKSRSLCNQIDGITVGGNLFEDEVAIRDQASLFFSKLFQSLPSTPDESLFNLAGPSVSEEQNQILMAIPTAAEIREVVFSLKKTSSLGPDGFPGIFLLISGTLLVLM